MVVHADDDCTNPVNTIPTIIPAKRLVVKISRIRRKRAPATFSMESLIRVIPNKKSPKPPANAKIVPTFIVSFPSLMYNFFTHIIIVRENQETYNN